LPYRDLLVWRRALWVWFSHYLLITQWCVRVCIDWCVYMWVIYGCFYRHAKRQAGAREHPLVCILCWSSSDR
jgi:hypothetical protein